MLKSILIVIIYFLASIGYTNLILSLISKRLIYVLPISIQFALGSGLLAILWLFLGLLGALQNVIIWPPVLIMAFAAILKFEQLSDVRINTATLGALAHKCRDHLIYFFLLLIAASVMAWFALLAWMRPPIGDAAAFYMVYPKIIAATAKLDPMPGLFHDFSAIGISGELHFAILMILANPATAKLFAWMGGVGILLLLRDITRQVGGGAVAQISAIIMLLTSATFNAYLTDGKTELFATLLGLASVYCLLLAPNKGFSKELIIISGLLTGFSITAKFSFVIAFLPAIILLLIFLELDKKRHIKGAKGCYQAFLALGFFGLSVLIGSVPHLLKNALLFGNPLAPFFGMHNWADQSGWYSLKDTLWIAATFPVALVFGQYPLMGGTMSILWLAAFIFLIFMPKERLLLLRPVMQLTLCGCLGLLFWVAVKGSVFVPRYFLVPLIMLIPLPALAVEYAWQYEVQPRFISFSFLFLSGLVLFITPCEPGTGTFSILTRLNSKHLSADNSECSYEASGYCEGFSVLNKKAGGERVFLAGYYSYWLRSDLLQSLNESNEDNIFDQFSPVEIWSALYHKGFKYIVVEKATHHKYLNKLDLFQAPPWLRVSREFDNVAMTIFHLQFINPRKSLS
jgi:hypothetical protein